MEFLCPDESISSGSFQKRCFNRGCLLPLLLALLVLLLVGLLAGLLLVGFLRF